MLEVLLAAAILAGAVLLVSQGFALGARAASLGSQYTRAVLLADARLAELMLEEDLGAAETEGVFEEPPLPEARWSLVAEDTETTGLVRVAVTVTWRGAAGERQVTLTALRPEFGLLPVAAEGVGAEGGAP